ncbi:MAG: hypothetical protein O7F73_12205 [Gammaproteobacteria bacterium]|nr:hypothetical protein [Gammaproteobacteria bacterium]
MIRLVTSISLFIALAGPPLAVQAAEQKNLAAVIAWSGGGRVFQIAPGSMEFLGAFEGIMYMETSEGEIDEAFIECSFKQTLHSDAKNTRGTGNCMIVQSPDDAVFAEFECDGRVGSCKGEFRLTEGTGIFKGIRGSSRLIIRSPLGHMVQGLSNGSEVGVSSAVAILPDLSYTIPAGGKR